MWVPMLALMALGLGLGLLLGFAARVLRVGEADPVAKQIESLMPGSQCGQCGFPGCTPAAAAIASGEASIGVCPPGGRTLMVKIADILGVDPNSVGEVAVPKVAFIDKNLCTGCTRCFRACPTDAVVGANGQLHTIITEACTGCAKCAEACPENCISLAQEPVNLDSWHWPKPIVA
jgi:Na+-translocating ferredoxin:NAD+ oxidoreductase subunit B